MTGKNLTCKQQKLDSFAKKQTHRKPWGIDLSKLNQFLDGGKIKNVDLSDEFLEQFRTSKI